MGLDRRSFALVSGIIDTVAACLEILLLHVSSIRAEGPLPEFMFKGVALDPRNPTFAPTGQLERACLLKTLGRVHKPLGKYYLYYPVNTLCVLM